MPSPVSSRTGFDGQLPLLAMYCRTPALARANASHTETRASLSRSVSASPKACTKKRGKTVSQRCTPPSVAVMTMRRSRQARQEGALAAADEDDLAADRRDQRLPVGGLQIRSDQVELGIDAVERGVADEHDQQQIVLLEHRRETGEGGADLVARRDVDVVGHRALRLAFGGDVTEGVDVLRGIFIEPRRAAPACRARCRAGWRSALPAAPVMRMA